MTTPPAPPTQVRLEPVAREQAPVLENLFELYCYDFSEQLPLELKPSGRFELPLAADWFSSAEHFPFFIRADERLVGFALARRGSRVTDATDVMDVAEFFVVRGARARRVGGRAAHALFAKFAAPWEVRVRHSNALAQRFWSRVVHEWLGHAAPLVPFSRDGVAWNLLSVPQPLGLAHHRQA